MKLFTLLIIGMSALLASCATNAKTVAVAKASASTTNKVAEGSLVSLDHVYSSGVTYNHSLNTGNIVFARENGSVILKEPGNGTNMLPETLRPPEFEGYSIAEARRSNLILLSWCQGVVRVQFVHPEQR